MTKKTEKNGEKGLKIGQIMGINVFSTSMDEVLTRVNKFLSHNTKFYITTPNPELILMAQDNSLLKKALNEADLSVPDGVGLVWANRFLSGKSLNIIHGRHLFNEICKDLNAKRGGVFLLGGQNGEAEMATVKLKAKYPNLKIEAFQGPRLDKTANPATSLDGKLQKAAEKRINDFKPDMLFVAFGNPKQEIWINKNLSQLKTKGAMAVGGTFRYEAGLSKLPPRILEALELEWLWRLITEPKRVGRILNAVVIFPLRVILFKFSGNQA